MMKTRSFFLGISFIAINLAAITSTAEDLDQEGLDIAEMIINLAPRIAKNLDPPATKAERRVTNATVRESGNMITYTIEGEDVYRNGRVLSTYRLRLSKIIGTTNNYYSIGRGGDGVPMLFKEERPLLNPTLEFLGSMLNAIYDIADMALDHRRVKLERAQKSSQEPLVFEVHGENQICEHRDLNRFIITIARHVDNRNAASYEVTLVHPYRGEPSVPASGHPFRPPQNPWSPPILPQRARH